MMDKKDDCLIQQPLEKSCNIGENYNGAYCGSYSWSQSLTDLEILVPVTEEIRSGKLVSVTLFPQNIAVMIKSLVNDPVDWTTVLRGNLSYEIIPNNSTWSLHPSHYVHICLEKLVPRWWDELIKGEVQIIRGVKDRSVNIQDLPSDERNVVHDLVCKTYQKESDVLQENMEMMNAVRGKPELLVDQLIELDF